MRIRLNINSRRKISILLLLLITLRLVPFNLLHYHNGEFAGFKAIILSDIQGGEKEFESANTACTFHQFLDLINHGFLLEDQKNQLAKTEFIDDFTRYNEVKSEVYFIDILNKGSPVRG